MIRETTGHFGCGVVVCVMFFANLGYAQSVERGVSWQLAKQRHAVISNVEYDLTFQLKRTAAIPATVSVSFELSDAGKPLVLDFNTTPEHVKTVSLNGQAVDYQFENGHIVIAASQLKVGAHKVAIEFTAGDQSLNRKSDFLYTLLVPDRASTVFPCFDQPDMKASFKLTLGLPDGWIASANGMLVDEDILEGEGESGTVVSFAPTKPISTYLFAFAAGEFQKVTREINGRAMTMLHRESDEGIVARNVDDIFTLHALSLNWMEDYTDIDYQFQKFDFVLIPAFQYGGMEHIGNIFYNADSLFLNESATQDQKLRRASLIAHETAHMWFGNLVTMKWFDDVWLKEVFANFMAAKIVHPSFPGINHDLGFLMKHHPQAYGEDRTGGTHPIQQQLENLRDAGTLYGRIIYQKAPVVMRQLETIVGRGELQAGLQQYLKEYQFGNAVWDDLISILDERTEVDLSTWSESWVKEPGAPEVQSAVSEEQQDKSITLRQLRKTDSQKFWAQQVDLKFVKDQQVVYETRVMIDGESTDVPLPKSLESFDFYLANGSELGYGYFQLDDRSKQFLLANIHAIEDDVTRGAAWLTLFEALIRNDVQAEPFLDALKRGLASETETLNRQNMLNQLSVVFWKYLSRSQREQQAAQLEQLLWNWMDDKIADVPKAGVDAKSAYFKTLVDISLTDETVKRLQSVWSQEVKLADVILAEQDYIDLACQLAIRLPVQEGSDLLQQQIERTGNSDRKKRLAFLKPFLSADSQIRNEAFETLKDAKNRRPEPWALNAVTFLHHPLRADQSIGLILPGLELLEEIQSTGDIFFPKRWLVATFNGHRSADAAAIVRKFLAERPNYPYRLKNKILQAADILFRVAD